MQLSSEDPRPQQFVWTAEDIGNAVAAYQAARNAVLNTPELLENILAHLPVHRLVVATRVSRAFQKMIMESPTLQKKLFLTVTKTEPEYCRLFRDDPSLETQQHEVFPTGYIFMDISEYSQDKSVSLLPRFQVVRAGPLLTFHESEHCPEMDRLPKRMLRFRLQPRILSLPSDYAYLREGAFNAGPWLQIYWTMPPCETVRLEAFWRGRKANGYVAEFSIERTIQRVGGVKCDVINEMPSLIGKVSGWVEYDEGDQFRKLDAQESSARAQLDLLEADGFKMSLDHIGQIEFPSAVMAQEIERTTMQRDISLIKREAEEEYEVQRQLCEQSDKDEQEHWREIKRKRRRDKRNGTVSPMEPWKEEFWAEHDDKFDDETTDEDEEEESSDKGNDEESSESEEEGPSETQEKIETQEEAELAETDDAEEPSELDDEEASSQVGEEPIRRTTK